MLLNKSARTTLGIVSVLMALSMNSAFAAKAPKAPVKPAVKPAYTFKISGSGDLGIGSVVVPATAEQNPQSGLWDMGAYSTTTIGSSGWKPFHLLVDADMVFGSLKAGTHLDLWAGDNQPNGTWAENPNSPTNDNFQSLITDNYQYRGIGLSVPFYCIYTSHDVFGRVDLGVEDTMSAKVARLTYLDEFSDIAWGGLHKNLVSTTPVGTNKGNDAGEASRIPSDTDTIWLQGYTRRMSYRLPTITKGLEVGFDYAPYYYEGWKGNSFSGLGAGMTYETSVDASKLKLGLAYAPNISLNAREANNIDVDADDAGEYDADRDGASRSYRNKWVHGADTYALSAAMISGNFNLSMNLKLGLPYNNRTAGLTTPLSTHFPVASQYQVKLGHTLPMASGSLSSYLRYQTNDNFEVGNGNTPGAASHGDLVDTGLSYKVGKVSYHFNMGAQLNRFVYAPHLYDTQAANDNTEFGDYAQANLSTKQVLADTVAMGVAMQYEF